MALHEYFLFRNSGNFFSLTVKKGEGLGGGLGGCCPLGRKLLERQTECGVLPGVRCEHGQAIVICVGCA